MHLEVPGFERSSHVDTRRHWVSPTAGWRARLAAAAICSRLLTASNAHHVQNESSLFVKRLFGHLLRVPSVPEREKQELVDAYKASMSDVVTATEQLPTTT